MPAEAFELEFKSITRWLADTFTGAQIRTATVLANFVRPTIFVEMPRAGFSERLPAARERETSLNITLFGHPDKGDFSEPWAPSAVAGRLEAALAAVANRIPLRDEAGTQAGLLVVEAEWRTRAGSDSDLLITLRYRRLVWQAQPELEGELIQTINYRKL